MVTPEARDLVRRARLLKPKDLSVREREDSPRSVGVGRVRVCMLCVGNSEQRERGVGASVNATMLSETL